MKNQPEHYQLHKISFFRSLIVRWYMRKFSRKQWSSVPEHLRNLPSKAGK